MWTLPNDDDDDANDDHNNINEQTTPKHNVSNPPQI